MEYIEFFNEGTPDPSQTGGKASSIIKLIKIGVNVPPGFVLKANSHKEFLEESENSQQLKEILTADLTIKNVLHISKSIKHLIQNTSIPQNIAVRIL